MLQENRNRSTQICLHLPGGGRPNNVFHGSGFGQLSSLELQGECMQQNFLEKKDLSPIPGTASRLRKGPTTLSGANIIDAFASSRDVRTQGGRLRETGV